MIVRISKKRRSRKRNAAGSGPSSHAVGFATAPRTADPVVLPARRRRVTSVRAGAKRIAPPSAPHADRELVDRCLGGDEQAWRTLYKELHAPLQVAIRVLLGRMGSKQDVVDDITAKVWFTVVDREAQLLDRFDAERGCRLSTFLAGLAKNEISRHFRAEGRRIAREIVASRRPAGLAKGSRLHGMLSLNTAMGEFLATLTPRERDFCENYLLSDNDEWRSGLSNANRWQLHRRVRLKLDAFLNSE